MGTQHKAYLKADRLSHEAIGAAIEVHRRMGPGLIESIYEKCLLRELELRSISACRQVKVPIEYKGYKFENDLKLDIYIEDCLILELKSVEKVLPVHKAQLMSYMKLLNAPIGLIMNFHSDRMTDGIHRMVLKGADGTHTPIPSKP